MGRTARTRMTGRTARTRTTGRTARTRTMGRTARQATGRTGKAGHWQDGQEWFMGRTDVLLNGLDTKSWTPIHLG